MDNNPVMYALAYKYQEGVWANFEKDKADLSLSFQSLLPSRQNAEDMIEDAWGTDYVIVPIEIVSYRDDVAQFEYDDPEEWKYDAEECIA